MERVRVRIAPSPTGDPHVGTAYIALFNYVFARRHGGDMILRIEDTDQARARSSSEAMIMSSLRWLGLSWDEGPDVGGPKGPYRQSERAAIHRQHAMQLVETGHAYRCFCTAGRLDEMRNRQRAEGQQLGYDRHCRALPPAEIDAHLKAGTPFVVRLKMPTDGITVVEDFLRGRLEFENNRIDDQVLLKSDGFPTYHLANVVDDHLMEVTHVIRAEEWISSLPKHHLLYQAFGWKAPVFAHMPLLRNADRSKISKRKNPTSLSYYRRAGILPHTLLNFLGLMGWSYGEDREKFTLAEMIERFDLKNIHLGGPIFDQTKLSWLNNQYLKEMSDDDFANYIRDEIFDHNYLKSLKPLAAERMDRFEQFVDRNSFFFNGALSYDFAAILPAGKSRDEVLTMCRDLAEIFDEAYDWNLDLVKAAMDDHKGRLGWKPKDYFMTVRMIVTGRKDSPPLAESMTVLGRDMVRFRLRNFADQLEQAPVS